MTTSPDAWTWDRLATADRATLEDLMRTGATPDPAQLDGHTYRGWNRGLVPRLTGEKFKKVFHEEEGRPFGHNLIVRQDRNRHRGEWQLKTKDGEPVRVGWFSVGRTGDEKPRRLTAPLGHTVHLDYRVKQNRGLGFPCARFRTSSCCPIPATTACCSARRICASAFRG